ncbi:efflux transporter periplasmic adaptor subunit [Betaproteobacteria bacterium GR16-43]|nr:efflux transporter periplasmic adaptor subunit [Betaproteobacteria bacterium GR16-43]
MLRSESAPLCNGRYRTRSFPMPALPRRRLAAAIITLFAVTALTAGVLALRTSKAAVADGPPPATPVQVATVVQADVATWDEFSGRLEAVERVDVRSRVAGAVHAIHFQEGALVKNGDLLVSIDPAPYAAEVDKADAQVVAARARFAYASSELVRSQRLWDEAAIAKRELDERVNARAEAEANVRAAEAALQSARLNLGYTQVRAPVSGRVGRIEVTVGNLVPAGPGAPALTTLVSVNPIYASFDADEQIVTRALAELPGGGASRTKLDSIPVLMGTAAGGEATNKGHLQLVDNQVNAKSGTVRVRAIFDNADGRLIPGQFAQLKLGHAKATPAILIHDRAVGTDQSKRFVLVVGDDNKAAYREVGLGASVDGLRIVTAGLKPNERIVVNGLQRVRPGSTVAPQPTQMAKVASR